MALYGIDPSKMVRELNPNNPMTEGDNQRVHRANILGDVFSLLARPSQAVAQGVYNATDKDQGTDFVGGLLQGIKGKGDVTFKNVLQDNLGVENDIVASIGGFVGDVALDPLTYVGLKGVKGMGEAESVIKALQSGADNVAVEAGNLMAKNPMRVGMTVAGKEIGSIKAPAAVRKSVEMLLGPAEDRKLAAKMFSRDAELPLGLNELNRVIDSSNAAQFHDFRNAMKDLYKGLTKEERRTIAIALDSGESARIPVTDSANTKFQSLQDYVDATRKITDNMFVDEGNAGLFHLNKGAKGVAPTDFKEYNPNYVYRHFENPTKTLDVKAPKEIRSLVGGTNYADFMKKRKANISLREAEEFGLNPTTDIVDIMDMRAAKHYRTMSRSAFVRDAIEQFSIGPDDLRKLTGGQVKDLGWVKASVIDNPAAQKLGDRYIPSFVAKAVNTADSVFTKGDVGAEAVRLHDKVMGQWKFINTALKPGYHIRNSIGDTILNLADGVTNPQRYGQAVKVLRDRAAINEATLAELTGDLVEDAATSGIRIGGKKISTDKIWELYGKSGSKSGLITTEIQRTASDLEKLGLQNWSARNALQQGKQAGTTFRNKMGDLADNREDMFRLAHFIDSLDKQAKKAGKKFDIESAAMEAGKKVRKFNIDYGNLSSFEKKTINKVIPFYSWMRRATPLNVELLFTKPGFMALYPKGQDLMQGMLGTDDGTGESLIPDWIREMPPVRIALGKQEDRNFLQSLIAGAVGAKDNEPVFLSAGQGMMPVDVLTPVAGVVGGLASGDIAGAGAAATKPFTGGLTPLIKAPIEMTTGRSLFNGQEITDWTGWAASQFGPVGAGYKAGTGGSRSSLLGALTGFSPQVATAARQEGEFRRRQDIDSAQRQEQKKAIARERIPNFDSLPEAQRERILARLRTAQNPEARRQRRYLTQILGQ